MSRAECSRRKFFPRFSLSLVRLLTGGGSLAAAPLPCNPSISGRPASPAQRRRAFAALALASAALQLGLLCLASSARAHDFDEQEYFDTNNTSNDWTHWQPTDANGVPNGSPGTNGWLMTRNTATLTNGGTLTPTASTGPTSVHSGGVNGGFLFLESSGGLPRPDRYFTRRTLFDASAHNLNISFAYSMYGSGMGTLELQVNEGTGWTTEWRQIGDDGRNGAWTVVTRNLFNGEGLSGKRYYGNAVRLRFRFISGSSDRSDIAIDTLRVFGPDACVETARVSLNPINNQPITAPVAITASLSGVGGSNPQVSFDGTTWLPNGSTYTPPALKAGQQTFFARATGFCSSNYIYDPLNPTLVSYDTTCVDSTPSSINANIGQIVTGPSVDLRSLFTKTGNVDNFTYRINGAAVGTPWNSTAFGTAAPQVVTLQITGKDPDCNATLVRSVYITVDNTCSVKPPTFGFDRPKKYVFPGSSLDYTLTVYNNDAGTCPDDTFTFSVLGNSHPNFASTFVGPSTLTVPAGGTATATIRVNVTGGTAEWQENVTTVRLDAASHVDPPNKTVTTTVYRDNPLMHNSINTDSNKHGGKWGTSQTNSKYGKFTCATCHDRNTGNVKRIRPSLGSAPDPAFGNFPGVGATITFRDVREGSADYGDDSRADKSKSNFICEVCHTYDPTQTAGVDKHAYNMSTASNTTHYNRQDCLRCHAHSTGFRAGCTECHGDKASGVFWPDSVPSNTYPDRIGAHAIHVDKIGNFLASNDKNNISSTTLEHKNATCDFCHPSAGKSAHDENISPLGIADVNGDGVNSDYFKGMDGTNDVDGVYDPTIKRCSNIDCHSNGKFTWPWYGDVIPPGAITNLAASTGTEIGTVRLNWTAPGNDNHTAGKPYRYEVRYSSSAITGANWGSAIIAGGPPTAKWPGSAQTMTVYGLAPGQTYHFAVKTADEAGNWSAVSNSTSAMVKSDTDPPFFRGLDSATPAFTSGAVNLSWSAATDHSQPITYRIWWKTSDQAIDYSQPPNAITSGLSYQVTGLTNGRNYKFAVRARDAATVPNTDTNTVQKEAIPQAPPEMEVIGKTYYAGLLGASACGGSLTFSGTTYAGSLLDAYTCGDTIRNQISGTTNGNFGRWTSAQFGAATNILGGSFRIYVQERSGVAQSFTVTLGWVNAPGDANFASATGNPFGSVVRNVKKDFRGAVSLNLNDIPGVVPAGKYLRIVLNKTTVAGSELRFRYASARYRSELTVYQQLANARPNAFTVVTPTPGIPAGAVDISWTPATDPEGDPVRYDVYGVLSDGTRFVIAQKTPLTTVSWDTLKDGIGLFSPATNVVIRVHATDGMAHKEGASTFDHREAVSGTFTIDNRKDVTAPAAVTDLMAEHRPKTGSVYLYWSAPGDDGMEGKASLYDIRYSKNLITEANFTVANTVTGAPLPGEPGRRQGYEVLGLDSGRTYYFALKTADDGIPPNWSGLSNVAVEKGGPSCGVCHGTPPDEAGRAGMHEEHGYTQVDCAKCHGYESINFDNDHSDQKNKMAYNNPKKGFTNTAHGPVVETATRVTYRSDGTPTGTLIYDDINGGGGYNDKGAPGDRIDNGSCFGFNATGVTGCHGAAGTGSYTAPNWGNRSSVSCAMCHGDPGRENKTPFNRPFEDGTRDSRYGGNVKIFKSAPGIDLLGNANSHAVGQHLIHLNFSYRFTGDSCVLCHVGAEHADGTVDVLMDKTVVGAGAQWNPNAGGPGTPGTCSGTSQVRCHGNNGTDPEWKVRTNPNTKLVECNECHGFSGKTYVVGTGPGNLGTSQIPHVRDGGVVRHCTWCHVEGHPREGYRISAVAKLNPVSITSDKHGLETGDTVALHVKGIAALNKRFATVTVMDANTFTLNGIDATGFAGTFKSGYWKRSYPAVTISAITKANPARVTSNGHGLATGDNVLLNVLGMTQLQGYNGPVTVVDANNFTLNGVNSTSYGTFTSGSWIPDDGAILVPNYSVAGIDYSSGGIHLKRVVNGRITLNNGELVDTEAETCWACHENQNPVVSEWGVNQKPLTGNMEYNYGSLNKTSWAGATWTSANFAYKTGALQSTHSVNPDVLGPGADAVEDLRCSYCHDVHDLNLAIDDRSNGSPFLRGTWMGNPYKEDGAPGRTANYAVGHYVNTDDFGAVPRGGPGTKKMGGYWIDQNSGYPTSSWSLERSAGLCTLCHSKNVDTLNMFGNASADWIGPNGHSNAVIGGSGSNRANIYNPALRGEGSSYMQPNMGYQEITTVFDTGNPRRMYGLRAQPDSAGVTPYAARDGNTDESYAYEEFNWGLDRETGTTQASAEYSYHRFSCSKCHNPHASRLPRLMITNCLDVSHNTWDESYNAHAKWSTWSTRAATPYSGSDWKGVANKQLSYATSAQNCHRYVELNGKAITAGATGITKANPAVVTSTSHGLATGNVIRLRKVVGMTELNDWTGSVTVLTANTFRLDGVNSTDYGTFVSGEWNRVHEQGWNKITPWREY